MQLISGQVGKQNWLLDQNGEVAWGADSTPNSAREQEECTDQRSPQKQQQEERPQGRQVKLRAHSNG